MKYLLMVVGILVLFGFIILLVIETGPKDQAHWNGFNLTNESQTVTTVRIDVDATRGQRLAVWNTTDVVDTDTTITLDSVAMLLTDGQIMVVHFVETEDE